MAKIILKTRPTADNTSAQTMELVVTPNSIVAFDLNGQPICVKLGQVTQGRAPAAPDNPNAPALDFPAGGGTLQQWDVASQTWV